MSPRRTTPPPSDRSKLKNIALFAESELSPVSHLVSLDKLTLPSTQPRRYFESQALASLVESVKTNGILQPILVRPSGERYEVVAGERRYRAAQTAELIEVPVIVREMTDEQAVQYALIENLQREDLNPIEETEGILSFLSLRLGRDTAAVTSLLYRMENEVKGKITRNVSGNVEAETVEQVFASLGRMNWQSFIRTRIPLLKLPADILEALRAGVIEYTKAKEIAKLESESERQELLLEAIDSSLSLSQIREKVKAVQPPKEPTTFAVRIETISKLVKKQKLWDEPRKRKKLESLLAKIEKLISLEWLDESKSVKDGEALPSIKDGKPPQNEPQVSGNSQSESPIELSSDILESHVDITGKSSSDESLTHTEMAAVSFDQETDSSESLDESQPDGEEEPTQISSELTSELPHKPLTHTEMVERLGVKTSTLSNAKKKTNFTEWSKSQDPEALAWQWVAASKHFVPLKN